MVLESPWGRGLCGRDSWSTTGPLRAGDWENVTFRIRNKGAVSTSTKFYIKMWVGSTQVGTWSAVGLCAGCSATGATSVKVGSAGDYQVRAQVDTTNAVSEVDESNNTRSETWRWSSPSGVDLVVEDIWSTTNSLRVGEWENVTFRIRNKGTVSTSVTFYTRLWIDTSLINTWSRAGLCAGCSATGSATIKVNNAGYHTVRAQVDTTNAVSESIETNNIRSERWYWAGGQVDLVVPDIWSTTSPLRVGDWENVTFRVKNDGAASTSTKFYIKMWVAGTQVGTWYANGMCAGCSGTGSINAKVNSAGKHDVKVEVDTTKVVPESDESNNLRTEQWDWSGGKPDLIVDSIWSTTDPLKAGEWENVTFRIKNAGAVSASSKFYTKMWVGTNLVGTWSTNSLAAGSTATGAINVRVASPGTYQVRVQVDATNTVAEGDESNNVRTVSWQWQSSGQEGADLIVQDISSTSLPLTEGEWENVTVLIKNQGTKPAASGERGGMSSSLEAFGTVPGGQVQVFWDDELGTPSLIAGDVATTAADTDAPEAKAMAFFDAFAELYEMSDPASELVLYETGEDALGMTHLRYNQVYEGVRVSGAELVVHIATDGGITAVNGAYVPGLELSPKAEVSAETAVDAAQADVDVPQAALEGEPELVVYMYGPNAHLTWKVRLVSKDPPGIYVYLIDAHDGQIVDMYEDSALCSRSEDLYGQ